MREVITKVYQFDELSDKAKAKALEKFYDINIDHEWWDCTYDDAADIGLKITEFDLGRGAYVKGEFTQSAQLVADAVISNHGEGCETYKTALRYLANIDPNNEDDDADDEFYRALCEDYRVILQKEYEYLTSEEAIIETIRANEYEFNENGRFPAAV